ncbi:MAG: outer membrane beta-barrel protein, partial [Ginsengibacter sp.]
AIGPAASGFNGNFYQDAESFREVNLDFLVGANKKLGMFGMDVTIGGNSMDQKHQTLSTSVTNFYVRDLYTINNGQIKEPNFVYSEKRVNSLYATVDFSFKDFLFLNGTGRNDWFSTLNPKSNQYLYPSVSLSFLFSEAFSKSLPSWLNYGKLRAAYAEVGGDTDPYTNSLFYSLSSNPFNGVPLGSISGSVSPNPNLKPLKVKEAEIGLELSILDRRINLDLAAYRKNTVDEILNVDISNASGFGQTKVNAGRLRNQGIEALLSVVIVRTQNLSWESSLNYTYNQSKVLELANNQQKVDVGTGNFIGIASEEVGKPMGSIRGVDYRRDDQGRIITVNGRFLAGNIITYGSSIPKYTGGWLNTFTYKRFRVFAQIDFKGGNKIISNSNFNMMRHGLHKASLVGREGGVVFPGVNTDGTPNKTAVEAESFYSDYRGKSLTTPFVYDDSFVKWRTISVGYDLSRFVNKTFIKGLNINAFINNVLVIKKHIDNLDPESQFSASDLLGGLESLGVPTTRNFGLNLNVKF